MKVAVIGSRGLQVNQLEDYLPEDTTESSSLMATGLSVSMPCCLLRVSLLN